MKIAITGHRPQRLKGQQNLIKKWAETQLTSLHPSVIYDGMAQGADQIVALVAKRLNIPIICCYPFPRTQYHPTEQYIMENNEVIFVSPNYSKQSYWLRDKFMVDNADMILSVWDGISAGGTFLTVNYAIGQGKKIINYEGLK